MKEGYYGDWIEAKDEDIKCPVYLQTAIKSIKHRVLSSFGEVKYKIEDEQIVTRLSTELVRFLPKEKCIGTIGWKAKINFDEEGMIK